MGSSRFVARTTTSSSPSVRRNEFDQALPRPRTPARAASGSGRCPRPGRPCGRRRRRCRSGAAAGRGSAPGRGDAGARGPGRLLGLPRGVHARACEGAPRAPAPGKDVSAAARGRRGAGGSRPPRRRTGRRREAARGRRSARDRRRSPAGRAWSSRPRWTRWNICWRFAGVRCTRPSAVSHDGATVAAFAVHIADALEQTRSAEAVARRRPRRSSPRRFRESRGAAASRGSADRAAGARPARRPGRGRSASSPAPGARRRAGRRRCPRVARAGDVAGAQAGVVVRRPDEAVELELAACPGKRTSRAPRESARDPASP